MAGNENLTRAEADARAAFLSVDSYDVALDLTTGETTFHTVSTIEFHASAARETFVDLIAPTVRSATLNGEAIDPEAAFDGARLLLPEVREGANTLVVDADGAYMNTGEGLHRFVDPVDDEVYLYTQFEVSDARRMFACFEQPSLKSVFTFTVTAPEHWRVISNSVTPEPTGNGEGAATWSFAPTKRISTYLTAIIAGPYEGGGGELTTRDGRTIPLGVYARASLAPHLDPENFMEAVRTGVAFYEERFDCDFPFDKYDQIMVPEYNFGAMENPGAVTFVEKYVFRSEVSESVRERRDLTILHELAHMWFGDLVTMRWWDDMWLNESFAEFASTTCMAEATRWSSAWTTFSSDEKSWAYAQDQLPSTHPIAADMVDLDAVESNFDGITYAKGASVLRQLVAYVGTDAFFEGLRAYFRKHAWSNTTLKDLLDELEKTSGRDLSQWSRLWLQTAGVNTLVPRISYAEDGSVTSFDILQQAPADHDTLRPHRLVVGGYSRTDDGTLTRTTRVELDVDGAATPVPELAGAKADLWLINDEDLAYAKVRLDERSLTTATTSLRDIDDSLTRTLIWGAAWDMVRDAQLSATAFTDLVLAGVERETEGSVIQTLDAELRSAVTRYAAPSHRDDLAARAADRLWGLARGAEPGGNAQFVHLSAFLHLARTDDQLDLVDGLRTGRVTLPGREIDTDLRWALVQSLAAGGRAGRSLIDDTLRGDDTFAGSKSAETAIASVPTAEAKATAWRRTVTESGLPNETLTAIVQGFDRVHDRSLLAPYVAPYFDMLEHTWDSRTSEIATRLIQGYFPSEVGTQDVVDRADAWLAAHPDAPWGLTRPVLEGRDGVARALLAQACDAEGLDS